MPATLPRARGPGVLHTAHGDVRTPAFVPLATKATVKGLLPEEVAALGYDMVLGNTFHLLLRPGPELIERFGGLRRFMGWAGPIDHRLRRLSGVLDGPRHGRRRDQGAPRRRARGQSGRARGGDPRDRARTGCVFARTWTGASGSSRPEGSMAVQAPLRSDIALAFDECTPFHVDRDYTAALDRAHAPLAGALPGLARRAWPRRAARVRDRAGRRPRGPAPRVRAAGRRERAATGSRSAGRWARRRRRCTRSSPGRPRELGRRARVADPATCSASARSTT